jgi:hypothetical protein
MEKRNILISLVIIMVICSACQSNLIPENPGNTDQKTEQITSPTNVDTPREAQSQNHSGVILKAATGKTIRFEAEGQSPADIPHLVLTRNGELTGASERTLEIEVYGIEVPPAGVTVTLSLVTQHPDPQMEAPRERIRVWSEAIFIENTTSVAQAGSAVKYQHEFDLTFPSDPKPVLTPTDYYRLDIDLQDAGQSEAEPVHWGDLEYAFLLENQWAVPLPEVLEYAPGAAPNTLVVYACDMFMPARTSSGEEPGIARRNFSGFLQNKIIPSMVEAFRNQSDTWQFPWYPEWTSYRSDEDGNGLSVALSDGKTWFHGPVTELGNARISLTLKYQDLIHQNEIPARLMKTFHHELFHNIQRSINKHFGGDGDLDGKDDAWTFFSEGTALFAPSVGQPYEEFHPKFSGEGYLDRANQFIVWDLNAGYDQVNQLSALYWRFLYEKCGGMKDGSEDPQAGMQVIQRAIGTLYSGKVVDVSASGDLVKSLPAVMDRALAGSACPFHTYEESLIAFARAIYALRLQNGRCILPGQPAGCELYDPQGSYNVPQVTVLRFCGPKLTFTAEQQASLAANKNLNGKGNMQYYYNPSTQECPPAPPTIPHSFGIDYYEIEFDPAVNGQSLRLEFGGDAGSSARFSVQLLRLMDAGEEAGSQGVSGQMVSLQLFTEVTPGERLEVTLPAVDISEANKLALIITRLDNLENQDPVGGYTLAIYQVAPEDVPAR